MVFNSKLRKGNKKILYKSRVNFQDKKILITDSESAQKKGLGGAQLHMTHGILP